MAVEGNRWVVFNNVGGVYDHEVLTIEGDTILNGLFYKKVYRNAILNMGYGSPDEVEPPYLIDPQTNSRRTNSRRYHQPPGVPHLSWQHCLLL